MPDLGFDYALPGVPQIPQTPAPVITPAPPAASNPAANPYVPTPAPPVGGVPSEQQMQEWILNSPLYKQGMENITNAYTQNVARENALYGLNSQYTSSPAVYTPETVPASFYAQLQLARDKAAHDLANNAEYQREMRFSSGNSGGQLLTDAGERDYQYNTLLQDINLQKQAREESVAQQNARGAAEAARVNAANAANKAISDQIAATQHGYRLEDFTLQQAQDRNKLLMDVSNYYHDLWWDPDTNQYRGPTV